ncbi:MAG: glycosyltransferase [Akkermansia sp.]|nr:glycosyltransferase [Akkermansia sp.]
MGSKLKILLACFACRPNSGSESGMGWNFAINVAKYHDVHVLVAHWDEESITQYIKKFPNETKNLSFHFIQDPNYLSAKKMWAPLFNFLYKPSFYFFYKKWQKRAYEYAYQLHLKEHFDIIHQVNIAGYRSPGFLWKLDAPFVIGPLGGFTQTNWKLLSGQNIRDILYIGMRNIVNAMQKRYGYAARTLSKHADTILVSDNGGALDIKKHWKRDSTIMLEVGTYSNGANRQPASRDKTQPLRICWVGHLINTKALHLLLPALKYCKHPIHLEIVGGGPQFTDWKNLAQRLQIENNVIFKGEKKHDDVLSIMSQCHLLCISSIKEGGTGTVALEALQNGLPIVCLNHCGYSTVVNENTGIKIPITNHNQIAKDFAAAFDYLYENEELRYKMALNCLKQSKIYSWDEKIKKLCSIYNQVLNK